jgi:hypothetical protein
MRSGAVGINLTSATHVFMVEPAINPSLTEQAIGRSWRMGQKREVHVKHLVVANSIESNILKLIEDRGQGGIGAAAGGAAGAGGGGGPREGEDAAEAAAREAGERARAEAEEAKMSKGEIAGHLKVGVVLRVSLICLC